MRKCTDCGTTKPLSDYTAIRGTPYTYGRCKPCRAARARESFGRIRHLPLSRSSALAASLARNRGFRQVSASARSADSSTRRPSSRPFDRRKRAITVAAANAARCWRGSGTTQVDATRTVQGGRQTANQSRPRCDRHLPCELHGVWPGQSGRGVHSHQGAHRRQLVWAVSCVSSQACSRALLGRSGGA